jgi:hypothetical protein
LTNRSVDEPAEVRICLPRAGLSVAGAVVLGGCDLRWRASADDDTSVGPRPLAVSVDGRVASTVLPPASWAMLRFAG